MDTEFTLLSMAFNMVVEDMNCGNCPCGDYCTEEKYKDKKCKDLISSYYKNKAITEYCKKEFF